jgi:hypothetical protein
MKKTLYSLTVVLFLIAGADAAPLFTLNPGSGSLTGAAGSTVGWGFNVTPDPAYSISVIDSFLVNQSTTIGAYTDIISYAGGPDAGMLLPTDPHWIEPFHNDPDPSLQTGVGLFQIDPGATPGAVMTASIHIDYEVDSVGTACPGCYVGTDSVEIPVQVQVAQVTSTPEPASFTMLTGVLGALLFVCAVRRRGALLRRRNSITKEKMNHFTVRAVLFLSAGAMSLSASTLSVNVDGIYADGTPTTSWSAPGDTWSISFLIASNPVVSNVNEGYSGNTPQGSFDAAFKSFVYLLNGSPVNVGTVDIAFYSRALSGLFNVCFFGCNASNTPIDGFTFWGPPAFSGDLTAPTILPGSYPVGVTELKVGTGFIDQPNGTVTITPESSTFFLVLATGVLLLRKRVARIL